MTRLLAIVTIGALSACGVVGAPVAPETIGVAPIVKRQQEQRGAAESRQQEEGDADEIEEPYPALQGQDEDLPPLRPVGTR
jgi:hypothetical protein